MKQTVEKYKAENDAVSLKAELTIKKPGPLANDVVAATDDYVDWFQNPDKERAQYETVIEVGRAILRAGKPELDGVHEFVVQGDNVHFETKSAIFNLSETNRPVSVRLVLLAAEEKRGEGPMQEAATEDDPADIAPDQTEPIIPAAPPLSPEEQCVYEALTQFGKPNLISDWIEFLSDAEGEPDKTVTDVAIIHALHGDIETFLNTGISSHSPKDSLNWHLGLGVVGKPENPKIWIGKHPGAKVSVNGKPAYVGESFAKVVRKIFSVPALLVDPDFEVAETE